MFRPHNTAASQADITAVNLVRYLTQVVIVSTDGTGSGSDSY